MDDFQEELKQIKQVRHLTADLDTESQLLTDEHIRTFLELNDWSEGYKAAVYRAAADALDTIATSEVMVSKKIRTQDLTTDGPAVSAELRKKAAELRQRADNADSADDSFFQIIPFGGTTRAEGAEGIGWG